MPCRALETVFQSVETDTETGARIAKQADYHPEWEIRAEIQQLREKNTYLVDEYVNISKGESKLPGDWCNDPHLPTALKKYEKEFVEQSMLTQQEQLDRINSGIIECMDKLAEKQQLLEEEKPRDDNTLAIFAFIAADTYGNVAVDAICRLPRQKEVPIVWNKKAALRMMGQTPEKNIPQKYAVFVAQNPLKSHTHHVLEMAADFFEGKLTLITTKNTGKEIKKKFPNKFKFAEDEKNEIVQSGPDGGDFLVADKLLKLHEQAPGCIEVVVFFRDMRCQFQPHPEDAKLLEIISKQVGVLVSNVASFNTLIQGVQDKKQLARKITKELTSF